MPVMQPCGIDVALSICECYLEIASAYSPRLRSSRYLRQLGKRALSFLAAPLTTGFDMVQDRYQVWLLALECYWVDKPAALDDG